MKKAASIFLRADITHRDVESLAGWMKNPHVTRSLNEDSRVGDQLLRMAGAVPEPLLTCRFNQRGRFFLVSLEEEAIGFVKLKQQERDCWEVVFAIGDQTL